MRNIYDNKRFPGTSPSSAYNDYPDVKGIDYEKFILTADRMSEHQRLSALKELETYIDQQKKTFLGYQVNHNMDYERDLSRYLNAHINNIGDPFQSGNFTVNSKFMERAVLDYFASLWNARWPHQEGPSSPDDKDWMESYWGYVLSMGSSEGNIYALWNARDYLAGRFLLLDQTHNEAARKASVDGFSRDASPRLMKYEADAPAGSPFAYTPIAFYSENTHYSIVKNMRILSIDTFYEEAVKRGYQCPLNEKDYPKGYSQQYIDPKSGWPYEVPSKEDGSIYIPALSKLVDFFSAKGYPSMLIFNYGSTFKGALDDVEAAVEEIVSVLDKNGMYEREVQYGTDERGRPLTDKRNGFWVHVDGALGAGYVPFLRKASPETKAPVFDFGIKDLHSLNMSGHKWLGAPWPCGVFMSKVKYRLLPVSNPAYIGASDSTFSGSRNGFSAMLLWDLIARNSLEEMSGKVTRGLNLASYFINKFEEVKACHKDLDLWLEQSPNAITVRFRRANDDIVYKFSLSNESLFVNGEKRDYSHIFLMDSVTESLLNELIEALKSPNAFGTAIKNIDTKVMGRKTHILGAGMGFR